MTTVPFGTWTKRAVLLQDLSARSAAPLVATAQLSRRCNLRCVHCFQVERDVPELSTEQWKTVLKRLADAGVLFLTLTGGEPALRDDLLQLIRHARKLSFAIRLKSNGVLLNADLCDALSAAHLLEAHLSVYAAGPDAHDRVTRHRGSHVRTMTAARRLRDRGTRVVLVCPLMAETFDFYEDLIRLAAVEGMDYFFDPSIKVQEDGCTAPVSHRLTDGQIKRLLADPRVFRSGEIPKAEDVLDQPVCRVGRTAVFVAPDGEVWPCMRLAVPMGNLLHAPLERIWVSNAELDRFASIRWRDLPVCRECALVPYCIRCHVDALREDGNLYGPSRLACRLARIRARVSLEQRSTGLGPARDAHEPPGARAQEGSDEPPTVPTSHRQRRTR